MAASSSGTRTRGPRKGSFVTIIEVSLFIRVRVHEPLAPVIMDRRRGSTATTSISVRAVRPTPLSVVVSPSRVVSRISIIVVVVVVTESRRTMRARRRGAVQRGSGDLDIPRIGGLEAGMVMSTHSRPWTRARAVLAVYVAGRNGGVRVRPCEGMVLLFTRSRRRPRGDDGGSVKSQLFACDRRALGRAMA
jgi:hypothetical protein